MITAVTAPLSAAHCGEGAAWSTTANTTQGIRLTKGFPVASDVPDLPDAPDVPGAPGAPVLRSFGVPVLRLPSILRSVLP
ncbi:hypothetical protein GCM10010336_13580 [Streptomyces goshikiensis]|nr:hypothetical protein GCM10010336_13580 [Streptomyces goshikiensis]